MRVILQEFVSLEGLAAGPGDSVDLVPASTEGEEKAFADKLNSTPKIVFSQTLDRAPWGKWEEARIVRNSAAEEVARLKRHAGRNLVIWGSISLAQSLMKERLTDEYRLVVCPVVLGSGRPLFGDEIGSIDLKLMNARALDLGAVSLKYVQAPARQT